MFKIFILAFFFCITFVCTDATEEQDEFVRILKEIRLENGVTPETEKITGFSEALENTTSQWNPNLPTVEDFVAYCLSKDVALFYGATDILTDFWSTDNLTKVLHDVLNKDALFLLDEAYEATALSIVNHPDTPAGTQAYILLFKLSKEAVVAQMPRRVSSIRAHDVPNLALYDRLSIEAKPELNELARVLQTEPSKAHLLPNKDTYNIVNLSVPKSNATSWNHVLAYLVWYDGKTEAAAQILDTTNSSMGMYFDWKYEDSNTDLVKCVDVTMVFEKIRTTGDMSYYKPLLDVLKTARSGQGVRNDSLEDVYPEAGANALAERWAADHGKKYLQTGRMPAPDFRELHAVREFDHAKAGDREYEHKIFLGMLQDWIEQAETDQRIHKKLYDPSHKNVGFGITAVQGEAKEGEETPSCWSGSIALY